MCGIVGIVHSNHAPPVNPESLREMCTAIAHRGPDDEGIFVQGQVGLGMRRLSIIDLDGGSQPVFNEDRSKAIVFNGEIYNYRELRSRLVANGHTFRSHSDTETVIHLYEEEGIDCVSHLRGMFGFAIWDAGTQTLALARDRFGIKPLYVVSGRWGLAFASELKALHAIGLTGHELDWEALDAFFQLGYIPAPYTPFVDVEKLEPGCLLTWRDGDGPTRRQYWDLNTTTDVEPANVEARVLDWIDESVTAHLESDVPIAAFLSGGFDSSAVVSSMSLARQDRPHAFTARYHGSGAEGANETDLASALAERYGVQHTVVDIEPNVQDLFEPIVFALDEPHADESAIPSWLISERVAADYKVALAGTGGDELFGGYRRHLGLLLSGLYGRVPRSIRSSVAALAGVVPEPKSGGLGVHRMKRFLRSHGGSVPNRYFDLLNRMHWKGNSSLYSPELAGAISGSSARNRIVDAYEHGMSPKGLKAALYLDYKFYLPDDLLHLSDRIAMAHSLEVRVPFVDHVLVENAFPIPDRVKIGPGRLKHLLKRALRSRLPTAHFSAPKRGFVGPTAVWLRNELKPVLFDELSADRMARLGFFEPGTVDTLLEEHIDRRNNNEAVLWALLSFSTWHRLFVERCSVKSYTECIGVN